MADKVKVLNAMRPFCFLQCFFLIPGWVVRVWMNCIGAISFQRSWKAHITHLARKVDIFVFRDFGGFKFFDQLSKNAKQYSHQHHCAPSPQGLWQRSPLIEDGWVNWDSVEYWRLLKPVFSSDLVHMYTPVPTNITWPDHMVSDFDSCSHLDLVSSYTICQLN